MKSIIHEIDGIKLINCTTHEITFRNKAGEDVVVPASKYTLKADTIEKVIDVYDNGLTFVEPTFVPSEKGTEELNELELMYPEVDIFVGSMMSAQAYPGRVVALTPTSDTIRALPKHKRYSANKFTIFYQEI